MGSNQCAPYLRKKGTKTVKLVRSWAAGSRAWTLRLPGLEGKTLIWGRLDLARPLPWTYLGSGSGELWIPYPCR